MGIMFSITVLAVYYMTFLLPSFVVFHKKDIVV